MNKIKNIKFNKVYSSRGLPTIKCTIITDDMKEFESTCPSGASTGAKEAKALVNFDFHDNEKDLSEYDKLKLKGVDLVIKNAVENLIPEVLKSEWDCLSEFDEMIKNIDGTENLNRFGANIILPLSICVARMLTDQKNIQLYQFIQDEYEKMKNSKQLKKILDQINQEKKDENNHKRTKKNDQENVFPSPNFNILNGGAHSGNDMPFQEIMINFENETYDKALEKATIFYISLKSVIKSKYGSIYTGYGDEGGYMPPIQSLDEAIELIREVNQGLKFKNLRIAVDSAANYFFDEKTKKYKFKIKTDSKNQEIEDVSYDGIEMIKFYQSILKKYPEIYLLEDPFAEDDIETWKQFTKNTSTDSSQLLILGDDLVVTNPKIIEKAIVESWANSILIKPNQIGTVSDTLLAVALAHVNNMKCMVSHRSGETEDDFISDFSVGIHAHFIKSGAPRGERLVKYNKLLKIYNSFNQL